ncbi:hydrogenase maturation protease [Candidatus Hydrogenedentota bacterium]
MQINTILVGLGNPFMCDDAVGIVVARRVHSQIKDNINLDLAEASVGGLDLIDILTGYDQAIIIDAVQTENGKPGDFYILDLPDLGEGQTPAMSHHVGLLEGLELANRLGVKMPRDLRIYAIEVADPYTFVTSMTSSVEAAIPEVVETIVKDTCERAVN